MKKKSACSACIFFILLMCFCFSISIFNIVFANSVNKNDETGQYNFPKISTIIPVYNSEVYLKNCLDSVINQTVTNIEIICINDGSIDNSSQILKEYEAKDNRIIVIDKKENEGANSARNLGLSLAKGDYITFLDSDDYLNLDAYEVALKEAKNKNLDILSFGWKSFPLESNWDKYKSSPQPKYFENDSLNAWFHCGTGSNVNIWNKFYRREFLIDSQIRFNPELKCAQDYYFNMRVFPRASKIEFISDKLYNYRRDSVGSISSKNKGYIRMQSQLKVIQTVLEDWDKNGYSAGFENKLLTLFLNWNMQTIKSIENLGDKSAVSENLLKLLQPLINRVENIIEKCTQENIDLINQFIIKRCSDL